MSGEITQLLVKWSSGDKSVVDELLPLVYDELRRLAQSFLRRERADHTLQPTALVHEAYLRLVDQKKVTWQSRAQFFGLAAKLMRNILVDHAREHNAQKRGGGEYALSLSAADRFGLQPDVNLLMLDDALTALSATSPQLVQLVELRYFSGLTIAETAQVLGVSHATVERDWAFARAWLKKELTKQ
ncbi:MAG TPA: sigma-70 family RNA polymerase sigma factor [Blastocatellia bacterium]|nr:sigma-70 family RNA polymerase sigma factor [Blastocatellia bacterium]